MVEHIPELSDLILFLANDESVVHIVRCGLTHGTLSDEHVLALILLIMTGGLLKIVSNWTVLTFLSHASINLLYAYVSRKFSYHT
jgi:hypothetical protein